MVHSTLEGPGSISCGQYLDRTLGKFPPLYGPHLYQERLFDASLVHGLHFTGKSLMSMYQVMTRGKIMANISWHKEHFCTCPAGQAEIDEVK